VGFADRRTAGAIRDWFREDESGCLNMHKPSRSDDFPEKLQRDAFGYFLNETSLDMSPLAKCWKLDQFVSG
jgi:hypothetical protein